MSVMNVKRGTQMHTKGDAGSSAGTTDANTGDAAEFAKTFGNQSVGDVANKIADSNYVDPTKKPRAIGNGQLDKDAFLKLMLAQMKHQDPTNPLQSHEMAAQLAQFTSLEQLNNINTTLSGIKEGQKPQGDYQSLALIGKKVSGDSSRLNRAQGDTKHAFNFEMMGDAAKAKITVKDAAGNVVRTMETGAMKAGKNSVEWNGLTNDGLPARAGEYRFEAAPVSSTGQKMFAKTSFEGRITGLNFTPEGPVLAVGNSTIRLSDVKKIEEMSAEDLAREKAPRTSLTTSAAPVTAKAPQGLPPEAMAQLAKMAAAQGMSLENPNAGSQSNASQSSEEVPGAEAAAPPGNIQDVPMSSSLLNEVNMASGGGS